MPDEPKVGLKDGPKKGPNKKTALILGGAGLALLAFFYFRHKKQENVVGTEPGTLAAQSFIPVTGGEGLGGGFGSAGLGGVSNEGATAAEHELFENLLTAQNTNNEFTREYMKEQAAENRSILSTIIGGMTGGGAPSAGAAGTVPASGTGGTASGATPPVITGGKPQPSGGCPPSHPHRGPRGCFNDAKCPNGCAGHHYQSGTWECQHKKGNTCVW